MDLGTFGDLNWLAVVVAAVAYSALGAIWYSPAMFSKPWIRLSGVTPGEGNSAALIAMSTVMNFVAAAGLAFLAAEVGAESVGDGILLGLIAAVAFSLTSLVVNQAFEGRPGALIAINTGYNVVGLVVAAVIVTIWD